jgi:hypothetical protein
MLKYTPSLPSLDAPSTANIVTSSLNDAFDVILNNPPVVSPDNFSGKWGAANTEEAILLYGVDDARLKDCIVAALA